MKPLTATLLILASACDRGAGPRGSGGPPVAAILRAALPAVVKIAPAGSMSQGGGSGFVIRADDGGEVIVTNHHVVWGATEIAVERNDHAVLQADVVGVDPAIDLAVLRCRSQLGVTPLSFADDGVLRPGDWLVSIGSPAGILNAVSVGVLSARAKVPDGTLPGESFVDVLFTDTVLGAGSSGGPVLNMQGEVVGVNTAMVGNSRGLGIVMPSHLVMAVARALARSGRYDHSFCGMLVEDDPVEWGGRVRVIAVTPGGPADRAGLRAEDRIVAIDGQAVRDASAFSSRAFMERPGTKWDLRVARGAQQMSQPLVLQDLPQGVQSR